MSHLAWVDPRIQLLGVDAVQAYLLNRGWLLRPDPAPDLLVFEGPLDDDGEPIIEVVPASEQMRDFRLRTEDLLAALSVLENRPAADILTAMLHATPAAQPLSETANGDRHPHVTGGHAEFT